MKYSKTSRLLVETVKFCKRVQDIFVLEYCEFKWIALYLVSVAIFSGVMFGSILYAILTH